ncbi:MAG: transposase [Pseudobacteriovorax sp.]|nr:transposase [Pseudobacteriovorax sp.]
MEVDTLLENKQITRLVAQIDIQFSNSMVEALFRRMKHSHLYNHPLTSLDDLNKKLDSYIEESNHKIPLQALKGATPAELFFGHWSEDHQDRLRLQHRQSIRNRIQTNRLTICGACSS